MQLIKQWFKRGFILPATAVCALSVPIATAQAAFVNYSFTGDIENIADPLNVYSVSGFFKFDKDTNVSSGVYNGAVKDFTFNINVGGVVGHTSSFIAGTDIVTISNNTNLGGGVLRDRWALVTAVTGDAISDLNGQSATPFSFDLRLDDSTGGLFSNTSLQNPPTFSSIDSSNLTAARWRLFFEDVDGNPSVYLGSISSLTVVPLPTAVLLFGAGLISLVGLGAGGLRNLRGSKA